MEKEGVTCFHEPALLPEYSYQAEIKQAPWDYHHQDF